MNIEADRDGSLIISDIGFGFTVEGENASFDVGEANGDLKIYYRGNRYLLKEGNITLIYI